MDIIDVKHNEIQNASKPTLLQIFAFQKFLSTLEGYDFNQHLRHTFSQGSYARELLLPKGLVIIGKVHRHAHLNIVSRGKVIVYTTDGLMQIDATDHPVTFESSPGTKRVVYALEDTVWTTIHLTESRDLKEIEDDIIIPESNYQELIDSIPDEFVFEVMENDMNKIDYEVTS